MQMATTHLKGRLRDESGQTTIFVLCTFFTFFMFFALVANVGQAVNRRVLLQMVADAGAFSGASAQAVGLNTISEFNQIIDTSWDITQVLMLGFTFQICGVDEVITEVYKAIERIMSILIRVTNHASGPWALMEAEMVTRENIRALFPDWIWLLTLLLSAIIQVFLVHNYVYQMANNAYYSLFKDKAYGRWNKPDKEFQGYPNYVQKKPLRAVKPLEQAGGKVHVLTGQEINWSDDDRAAVPMMPFFEEPIVVQLRNYGITREGVRLKVGTAVQGQNYLDTKFLRMAMGTEGGFPAFANMIGALAGMANKLGQNYTQYTDGYSEDYLSGLEVDYDKNYDELNEQDDGQKAMDRWDEDHGDWNHDGYNDFCEMDFGNNHPNCKNNRPWE